MLSTVCVFLFVFLAYLENGRVERTVCLQQIFFQGGEKCYTNFQLLKAAFGEQTMWRTQVLEWGFKLRIIVTCDLYWRCEMLRMPIEKQNRWKCGLSEGTCAQKQKNYFPWSWWHVRNSLGSFQSSLNDDLNRCHIATKFICHLLSEGQKGNHVSLCQDLQERLERDPVFFLKIFAHDEMWF